MTASLALLTDTLWNVFSYSLLFAWTTIGLATVLGWFWLSIQTSNKPFN